MTGPRSSESGRFIPSAADRGTLRFCSRCKEYLPRESFYKSPHGDGGLSRKCRVCHSQQSYESRLKRQTPAKRYGYERTRLLAKYGLTQDDYDRMLREQGGGCAICGGTGKFNSPYGVPLAIDHCHETGKVRGLLCGLCNMGLGKFRDRADLLNAAVEYLAKVDDGAPQPDCE